jgi:hypothetical protein
MLIGNIVFAAQFDKVTPGIHPAAGASSSRTASSFEELMIAVTLLIAEFLLLGSTSVSASQTQLAS